MKKYTLNELHGQINRARSRRDLDRINGYCQCLRDRDIISEECYDSLFRFISEQDLLILDRIESGASEIPRAYERRF